MPQRPDDRTHSAPSSFFFFLKSSFPVLRFVPLPHPSSPPHHVLSFLFLFHSTTSSSPRKEAPSFALASCTTRTFRARSLSHPIHSSLRWSHSTSSVILFSRHLAGLAGLVSSSAPVFFFDLPRIGLVRRPLCPHIPSEEAAGGGWRSRLSRALARCTAVDTDSLVGQLLHHRDRLSSSDVLPRLPSLPHPRTRTASFPHVPGASRIGWSPFGWSWLSCGWLSVAALARRAWHASHACTLPPYSTTTRHSPLFISTSAMASW